LPPAVSKKDLTKKTCNEANKKKGTTRKRIVIKTTKGKEQEGQQAVREKRPDKRRQYFL